MADGSIGRGRREGRATLNKGRHSMAELKNLSTTYSAAGMSGEESTQWRYGIELTEPATRAARRDTVLTQALNKELDKGLEKKLKLERKSGAGRGAARRGAGARRRVAANPWQSVVVGGREVVMEAPVLANAGSEALFGGENRVTVDAYMYSSVGKTKCALCTLYFKSDSVKGTTCNKHVSAFRSLRGARVVGRRFETASFLYQEAKLCAMISSETKLNALIETNVEADEAVALNNVALKKPAWQSTTVDGRGPDLAVDGADAAGADAASCTRREYEAWWEVDLGGSVPVVEVRVAPFRKAEPDGRPYGPAPVYVFLLGDGPLGPVRLHEARKRAKLEKFVEKMDGDDAAIVWTFPDAGARASAVRVQVKGTRSLQLAQVTVSRAGRKHDGAHATAGAPRDAASADDGAPGGTPNGARTPLTARSGPGTPGLDLDPARRGRGRIVPLPSPVKHKTAFFWDATREVAIKPLRRGRSAADFDAFEVDQLYWKTLLRYDRYDAEAARHRDVAGSFSGPQLRTARDLFASCSPRPEERELGEAPAVEVLDDGDGDAPGDGDAGDPFASTAVALPQSEMTRRAIEAIAMDVSRIYAGLRRAAASLFTAASSKKQEAIDKGAANLWDVLDASSCFAVATELYKLARLDEAEQHDKAPIMPLPPSADGDEVAAAAPPARRRSPRRPRRLATTTQRRDDRNRAARETTRALSTAAFVDRARRGAPTVRLQRNPPRVKLGRNTRALLSLDASLEDVRTALQSATPKRLITAKKRFDLLVAREARTPGRARSAAGAARPPGLRAPAAAPKLVVEDQYDYRGKLERRRANQRELLATVKPPRFVQSIEYKACGLCMLHFPSTSFWISCSHDCIIRLLERFGLSKDDLDARGANAAALCYNRLPLCCFCSQFFDPDNEDGLAKSLNPNRDATVYEPYFDSEYPETYTSTLGANHKPGSPIGKW
ncbi:hypothetical protein JL721_107 [Aureococcus anophagefferens]|nr:hypothetical protein JL721_107 [Aureococcus anophagefferens]